MKSNNLQRLNQQLSSIMCKDLTDLTNKHGDRMGSKSANSVHPITKYKAKGMNGDTSRDCGTLDFRIKPHDG